jgi:hypothetical protein
VYGQTGYKVLDNVLASDEAKAAMKEAKRGAAATSAANVPAREAGRAKRK